MRKIITAAVSALLVASCAAGTKYRGTYEHMWAASTIQQVKLADVDGSVQVVPSTDNQVRLRVRVETYGIAPDKDKPNDGYFDSEVSGGTLILGKRRRSVQVRFPFLNRSKMQVDYELRVPSTTALDLALVNGRISARGINGDTKIVLVNGPIDVETAGDKELFANNVNGHVRAVFLRDFAGARLKTVNGGVQAVLPQNASFTCSLSQVNGDFEASSSFPLRIHSHPGSRRVSGEVNGGRHELQISTVNGDVAVQQLAGAR